MSLTVTDDEGLTHTVSRPYTALQPPVADFIFSPVSPNEAQNTHFTDQSTHRDPRRAVSVWSWDFGDGTGSGSQNPVKSYQDDGTYDVTLRVADNTGISDTVTKQVTVNNLPPTVDIGPDSIIRRTTEAVVVPGNEIFRNWSEPRSVDRSNMQWFWDVGDGRTFTTPTLNFTYDTPGTYTIAVTLTDPQGATATDTMVVTVYDDWVPPTTTIGIEGSRNVALVEDHTIPSLLGAGALVYAYSSQANKNHSPANMLDLAPGLPWATAYGQTSGWVKILLAGGRTYEIDRVRVQPRSDGSFAQRVKDFEVWVSTITPHDSAFTKVLAATAANNGNLQEFLLPGGPVQAKWVKYVVLSNYGDCCHTSTTTFQVVATGTVGAGGVVAVSSQDGANAPEWMLDGTAQGDWRSATGQNTDQWVKLLLEGGQTHQIHAVLLDTVGGSERVKDIEVWVSTTTANDAAFTKVYANTAANRDGPQLFALPSPVDAKYVKVMFRNNYGAANMRVRTLQVRAVTPPGADGWYNSDVLVKLAATDNSGGSGVARIEWRSTLDADCATGSGPARN